MMPHFLYSLIFLFTVFLLRECNGGKEFKTFTHPPRAMFVFGDSLSDTGNVFEALPFRAKDEMWPYGSTFFGGPSGRYSDGRLIVDFLASNWGLPFVQPYFKNIGADYRHGINFAVAGAMSLNISIPVPFFLPIQTDQFVRFKHNVHALSSSIHNSGFHLPDKQAFEDGVYIIFIGINDFISNIFWYNATLHNVTTTIVPPVVSAISKAVQDLNKEGAKNFMVFNLPAIGCTPLVLALASHGPFNSKDKLGCLQEYNNVLAFTNHKLEKSLRILKKQLEDISIVVVDMYQFFFDAIRNPTRYGFKKSEKFKACCGNGGDPYNYNPLIPCGNISSIACNHPREYMSWDGLHWTEAFSQRFVDEMVKENNYMKHVVPN